MRAVLAIIALLAMTITPSQAQPVEGFANLAERLSPAVVNISTAQTVARNDGLPTFPPGSPLERFNDLLGDGPRITGSLGSGFIIDASGLVVTNNHVIDEADEVEVTLSDGRTLAAEIIGRDAATDLALLRVQSREPLPSVNWADSDAARVGDWVIAIGNPFGLGGSLSAGVISARGREIGGRYDDYIQTDVAINRGNSGGPMFDMDGDVVGVNTAIYSPTGTSVGISFSIPSNIAHGVIEQLLEFGETRRGWLGVNVQSVTSDMAVALGLGSPRGALVSRVDPEGPAAAAGLRVGDLILAFDGRAVPDDRRLPRIVAESAVGSHVNVDILRRGEPLVLEVEIARLEEEDTGAQAPSGLPNLGEESAFHAGLLGLTLEPLNEALRRRWRVHPDANGLVVTGVDPSSDASGKVREGDVVEEIAWTSVESLDQARQIVNEAAGSANNPVLLTLNRAGQFIFQTVRP